MKEDHGFEELELPKLKSDNQVGNTYQEITSDQLLEHQKLLESINNSNAALSQYSNQTEEVVEPVYNNVVPIPTYSEEEVQSIESNSRFSLKQRNYIFILICILAFAIPYVFLILSGIFNSGTLVLGVKYKSVDAYPEKYFVFYNDGICSYNGNVLMECTYEKNSLGVITAKVNMYGSKTGMEYSFDMRGDYILLTRETRYLNGNLFDDEVLNFQFELTDEVEEEEEKPLKIQMDNNDDLYEV